MKRYYYWLDTYRFMSAFLVVLTHARFWFFQPYGLLEDDSKNVFTLVLFFLSSLGRDAVVAFFILSGFLVGGRTIEKLALGERVSPTSFAASRIVRIIVPLAAVLLINALFNVIQSNPNDWWRIIGNLLCLQGAFVNPEPGIGVLWTMSYIVWFYVLIWSFVLIAQKKTSTIWGGITTLTITLWVFAHMGSSFFYVLQVSCGILSYFLSKRNFEKWVLWSSIVAAVVITGLCRLSGDSLSFQTLPLDNLLVQSLQTISYAVVIGLSVQHVPQSPQAVWIEKTMSKLSKFSYSLYLVHLPIVMMMVYLGVERLPYVNLFSLSLYVGGILICMVSAWLIYVLIENPSNKLKVKILNKLEK